MCVCSSSSAIVENGELAVEYNKVQLRFIKVKRLALFVMKRKNDLEASLRNLNEVCSMH